MGLLFIIAKASNISFINYVFKSVLKLYFPCLSIWFCWLIIGCHFQEEQVEKRVFALAPTEHFGPRILVKCLQLKWVTSVISLSVFQKKKRVIDVSIVVTKLKPYLITQNPFNILKIKLGTYVYTKSHNSFIVIQKCPFSTLWRKTDKRWLSLCGALVYFYDFLTKLRKSYTCVVTLRNGITSLLSLCMCLHHTLT